MCKIGCWCVRVGGRWSVGLNEILLLSTVKVGPVMYASYDIFYMIW